MIDITEVIFGHRYDPNGEEYFYEAERTHPNTRSNFWLSFGAFDKDCNPCGSGWNIIYNDGSNNQAYHLWFYVATAYFDGAPISFVGNFVHDGYTTGFGGWLGDETSFEESVLEPLGYSMERPHANRQDYDLGVLGVDLGSRLRNWQRPNPSCYDALCDTLPFRITTPSQVSDYLRNNIK